MSDGIAAYHTGDYGTAVADLQQATSASSGTEQAKAYYMLGLALHKDGRATDALKALQRAQAIDPTKSFASSPGKFDTMLQIVSRDAGVTAASTGAAAAASSSSTPSTDKASVALTDADIYVDSQLAANIDSTRLESDVQAQGYAHTKAKIAVLYRLPNGYSSTGQYTAALHKYLGMGNDVLVVAAVHGAGAGVADVSDNLTPDEEDAIAARYVSQVGSGDYTNGLSAIAHDAQNAVNGKERMGPDILLTVFLVVVAIILIVLWSANQKKKAQIAAMRGPLLAQAQKVLQNIEYLDNYTDVLPKNNADSDQVRAFRQAAAAKYEQANKILNRATEPTDLQRADSIIEKALMDTGNARRFLDKATGGTANIPGDDAIRAQLLPESPEDAAQVPSDARGVSFFSSRPAPIGSLVPVTIEVAGKPRQVLATAEEAAQIRRGQQLSVRSFTVGNQQVPWWACSSYDPYRDYYAYNNSGWSNVAAGFIAAELLDSVFAQPGGYYGGGGYSPYAFAPGYDSWNGWDTWGGWDNNAYSPSGGQNAPVWNDPEPSGAGFMGSPGYDTSDYGGNNPSGTPFMNDQS
jgi:tetratricopeptide (TPR) repeat protein